MGIHGLWRLLEPAGRDVTLESLENKVLAIDVSLWLHQAQQGQSYGASGASAPHAHLLTLFHRISKLLFYRVKPVFIFDGIAPELKKKTIFARKQRKQVAGNKSKEMRQQLLLSLAKSEILKTTQSPEKDSRELTKQRGREAKKIPGQDDDNLFVLPSLSMVQSEEPNAESDLTDDEDMSLMSYYEAEEESEVLKINKGKGKVEGGWKKWNTWIDPHEVDLQSKEFQSLPVDVRREILTDLKEARKQSSWGRLHKMPKELGNFSNFQMSRLLHRRKVQEVLEKVEEEVASSEVHGTSLKELEVILADKGISGIQSSQRIASDESKGFILLSGLKDQKKGLGIGDEKMDVPVKLESVKEEEASELIKREVKEENYSAMKEKDERIRKFLETNEVVEIDSSDSEILEVSIMEKEYTYDAETVLAINAGETSSVNADLNGSVKIESSAKDYLVDEDSCGEDLSQGEIMAVIKAQVSEASKVGIAKIGKAETEAAEVSNVQTICIAESDEESKCDLEMISELQKQDDCGLTQEEVLKIISEQRNPTADMKEDKEDSTFYMKAAQGQCPSITEERSPMSVPKIGEREQSSKVTSKESKSSGTNVEVVFDVSGDSDSDGSSFLEVEGYDEVTIISSDNESSAAVLDQTKSLTESTPTLKKELELVINLETKSNDDIFADVFEDADVEEDKERDIVHDKKPDHEFVLDSGNNEKDIGESEELASNEKRTEDNLDGDSDSDSKVTQDEGNNVEEKKETYSVMTQEERKQLTLEMRKLEREASGGVTEKARLECQELLGLFGVPWVVAPYEAEAQCAFFESLVPNSYKAGTSSSILNSRPLVEGTVTEDSDVWAFGASVVYRHVFDRRVTRVRVYSKQEIQRRVGLSRVQIIQLALLTGSDYTVGLPGIGTVTALEVLAAFPGEKSDDPKPGSDGEIDEVISGLQHFADWWRRVEMNEMERTPIGHSYFDPPESVCAKLKRRLLTCWRAVQAKQPGMSLLPPTFPSRAVVMAYLRPSVDESRDTFLWRKPDEEALRSYAKLHFGWTPERIDSVLRPLFVRLKLADRVDHTQTSLHSYFSHINAITKSVDLNASSNLGFRTQKALERIAGKCHEEDLGANEGEEEAAKDVSTKKPAMVDQVRQRVKGNLPRNKSVLQNMKSKRPPKARTIDDAGIISGATNNKKRALLSEKSPMETGFESSLCSNTKIPQREKDKQFSLQSKMKAIEVMRKVSLGSGKRAAPKRSSSNKKKLKREEVQLSESSDSD